MKTIKNIIIASVIATLLFTSCSVERRRYRKGYNVETKSKKTKTETTNNTAESNVSMPDPPPAKVEEPSKTEVNSSTANPKTIETPKQTIENKGTNNSYSFSVVVGPRPDKKKVQAKHKPK